MNYFSAMEDVDGKMQPRRAWGIEFTNDARTLYAVSFDRPALESHLEMLSRVIGADSAQLIELRIAR